MTHELVIDSFAGGGGASMGIEQAIGRPVDIAINHDAEAVAMHMANHPETQHFQQDIWKVRPRQATKGRPVALAWFSPDCKHFSKAKGGKPVEKSVRDLAWVVVEWARDVRPRVIMLENVEEFRTWGPLTEDNMPDRDRKGETFNEWLEAIRALGYEVEWRELRACDYGAPTIRKRLFIIARCDGKPIAWPAKTHGKGLLPFRTAAECIDFYLLCPSIFERKRPLVEATLRRIANGIRRYVIETDQPFIIKFQQNSVGQPLGQPLDTVMAGAPRFGLAPPFLASITHNKGGAGMISAGDEPVRTITTSRGGEQALIAPTLVQTGYGEREGQSPRSLDIEKPLGTVVGGAVKHALVASFLAKHFGDHGQRPGSPLNEPMGTVTTVDHHAEVRAFLVAYFGNERDGQAVLDPFRTVTSKERFGLVYIHGEPYEIADIGMRMLTPRELFRAQGFPDGYVIDPFVGGKRLTKTAQIRMCGNSVCPPMSRALVTANVGRLGQQEMWAGYEVAAGGGA